MSVILAGDKCKKCSEKFYVSWSKPDWFNDKDGKIYRLFREMQVSKLCPQCYIKMLIEELEDVCALLGVENI